MLLKNCFIKDNNPGRFRHGEWALILGVKMVTPFGKEQRPCYHVQYENGDEDFIPVYTHTDDYMKLHTVKHYEFSGEKKF